MQSFFVLITTMFQKGINKKITFNKHFARKYIRAYTSRLEWESSGSFKSKLDVDKIQTWQEHRMKI